MCTLFVRAQAFAALQPARVLFADNRVPNRVQTLVFDLQLGEKLSHLALVIVAVEARLSSEAVDPVRVPKFLTIPSTENDQMNHYVTFVCIKRANYMIS